MASDNFDIDWDDDPFDGEFSLDMDFDMDPFKGKGFIASMASGFLSGIGDETIGSNRARVKTLRTLLPDTFSNAFDRASKLADRFGDLKEEFQRENVESVKSLQSIAGSLATRLEGKISSSKTEAMSEFSQKDFSSWESGSSSESQDGMDDVQEFELQGIMDTVLDRQEGLFYGISESLNGMAAAVGGSINAAIGTGNRQLVNIETGVRDLLDYQRNVQLKLDQAQVSLLARTYAANIKYYKFMERGMHTEVAELKKIVKGVMTSDFEKMSTFTRSKQHLQNSIFSTVGKRVGGLTGLIRDKFGKDARQEGYDSANSGLGMLADMLEMSEGAPMSKGMIGNMLGKMAGGKLVEEVPNFFKRGKGKQYIDKLALRHPEQAEKFNKQYGKLSQAGSRASYMANAGVGLVNYMAEDYEQMDEMPFLDYEDYLESLPPDQKPLSKTRWTLQNAASNRMKAGMNTFMSEMNQSKGTQYTLKRRNPRDLNNAAVWKETNNITLNEVIPGLISRTNQILEKIRTGKDETEMTSYNYMRGQFQTETQKQVSAQADLMPFADFSRYAQSALEFVDDLDPDRMLSPGARKAFAQVIAKDVDREKSFNPYYYLGEIPGMSPANQQEVHAVVRKHFGLKDEHIEKFKSSKGFERMDIMTQMPTAEAQERLSKAGSSASNLKDIFPDVAERIDMLRSTGNEQLLRDLGVIYTEGGIDKINMEVFHTRLGKFMDNPNDPTLRGMIPGEGGKPAPTLNDLGIPKRVQGDTGAPGATSDASFMGLSQSLGKLTEKLDAISTGRPQEEVGEKTAYFDPESGLITTMSDNISRVADSTGKMEVLMDKLLTRALEGKLFNKEATPNEERQEERAKDGIFAKLKKMVPSGSMNKGMELLMRNSPMILGGLLGGGLGSMAKNPIIGAGMALGGIALGGMLQHWGKKDSAEDTTGKEPSDDENVMDENGETILESAKLKAGMYIDAVTKRVISTYKAIRGPIIDMSTKAVLSITALGGKIFGADGRAVMLSGLQQAKDALVNTYNFIDPVGKLKSAIELGKGVIFQQDVFVKGDTVPRLRAIGFKNVEYWKETAGSFNPIKGWNEIEGPVYDEDGNELISQAEYDEGLTTSSGQKVRQMGGMAASALGAGAGFLKGGMDKLLGKVGYQRGGAEDSSPTAAGKGGSTGGVERRLDRIYKLLAQKFGMEVEDETLDGETGDLTSPGIRLNSLADKARVAKEEQTSRMQKAIINIGEKLGVKEEGEPKEKKDGLFGKLFGMMGSVGGFMTNLMKNPLGTILGGIGGSLAASTKRLASIGSALFSGVLGIASPIFKLLKSGFIGVAKAVAGGGSLLSKAGGLLGGGASRGGGKLARMARGGGRLGMMAAAGTMAYDMFSGSEEEEEEEESNAFSTAVPAKTMMDTATDAAQWIPQVGLTTMAAEAILPSSFIDTLKNTGVFWSSDGEFFTNQREMQQHEANIKGIKVGGSTYRTTLTSTSPQKQIRFAMYGIKDWDSSLGMRVDRLEVLLLSQVAIAGGRASFKDTKEVGSIVKQFASSAGSVPEDNILGWFNVRFKPIFLVWCAAANTARMGDLTELDAKKDFEIVMVMNRIIESIPQIDPFPYQFDMAIDDNTGLMSRGQTESVIASKVKELRELYPDPNKDTKITTGDEQRQKNLTPERSSIKAIAWLQDKIGSDRMKSYQEKIDAKFTTPAEVKEIDISDLHKDGNTPIDPFTMSRLATYGNVDNMGWRIDAVLKLERYCEEKVQISGDKINFLGTAQSALELFKPMFRIDSKLAETNFVTWFDNRFMPVLKLYVREVKKYRGQTPKQGWLQLSATNKVDIARLLSETTVVYEGDAVTVWNVKAGPFPNSVSGDAPDRATIYLKVLDTKAMKAVLDDPALEEASSKAVADTLEKDPVAKQEESRRRTQDMMARIYGKKPASAGATPGTPGQPSPGLGKNYAAGGFANAFPTDNQPGGVYDGGWSDSFTAAVVPKPGEDAGVKIKPEEGEKMLLNGLLKAGVTDNKQLALALALAKVETGNYSSTVENTNWSAATLKKYFRNIPDMATAEKVAALPPAQRAMYVYGKAPKGPTLGNKKPEDGWLYRGRGLFQLTGKANYEKYARESGIDVVSNPKLVSEDPAIMTDTAVRYLMGNKAIQSIASTGSFDEAVRGINGGGSVPFTEERRKWYNDYLAKLQSGALTVGEVKTSDFAGAAAANPTTEVPNAADANIPPDAPSNATDNIKPANKSDITAALNNDSAAKAVQAGGPSTASAPTAAQVPEPVAAPEAPKPAPTPAAKPPAPVASTPAPKAAAPAPVTPSAHPAPAAPQSGGTGSGSQVADIGTHQLLSGIAKQLKFLSDAVEGLQRNDHGVRLS